MRRDGTEQIAAQAVEVAVPCCIVLAGGSPVRVIAGEPGSRVQLRLERDVAERTVESLTRGGSKEAGRNQLNAVQASSHYQPKGVREGRASHFKAKAMDSIRIGPERVLDLPGVLAAARFERTVRNTGDPSWQPTLGKDRAHKARAESERSQAGVRGAHSTDEGGDKPLEGEGPALVTLAMQVSARACP